MTTHNGQREVLHVTDSRTGRSYDLPITNGSIKAIDLRKITVSDDDFGLLSYDPAYLNTASCRSAITYIDGEKGILRYRGYPIEELAERASFLDVMWKMTEPRYHPDPVLEQALNVLFILHADHEQNCSTSAMRVVGSSRADPYSAAAGATAALYGPLHGGANEQVLRMLREIGSVDNIPAYVERVKKGELRLMGFGHRVYRNFDPRATIIKTIADLVFEVTGPNRLLDIALELERIALADDYFVDHKLYPNVDFYSGIIYQAMGFPVDMFPVLFAIGRMPGWLAQWEEGIQDPDQKISRPRQIYVGRELRHLGNNQPA